MDIINSKRRDELKNIERSLDEDRMGMILDYIVSGLRNIYENKLCFESIISMTICQYIFPLFLRLRLLKTLPMNPLKIFVVDRLKL